MNSDRMLKSRDNFSLMKVRYFSQRTLTYFVRGSITVRLTSNLTGFDSAVLLY